MISNREAILKILLFIRMSYFKSGTATIQEGSITRGTPTSKVSVETIPSLRGSITQVPFFPLTEEAVAEQHI